MLGLSFSLSRLLGIAGFKNKLSRKIGVPLTKNGRAYKFYKIIFKLLKK